MTKTEKAVSWGLTGFFGVICLAAAPQLSVGFLIKYGILSGALGFGITAISSAVGKAFPDGGYTYNASGSRSSYGASNNSDSYTAPRQNNWYYFGLGNNSRRNTTPVQGKYLGSRIENVLSSHQPSAPVSSDATFLRSRYEPVPPSYTPSATSHSNSGGGYFSGLGGSSSPSNGLSSEAKHIGTHYEPV